MRTLIWHQQVERILIQLGVLVIKKTLTGATVAAALLFSVYWFWWPIHNAESIVKESLNDPDSAKFSEVTFFRNKGGTCGLVNAKNRLGGYVGNTAFTVSKTGEVRFRPSGDDKDAPIKERINILQKLIEYKTFELNNCGPDEPTGEKQAANAH